jgi:hypothetical protein
MTMLGDGAPGVVIRRALSNPTSEALEVDPAVGDANDHEVETREGSQQPVFLDHHGVTRAARVVEPWRRKKFLPNPRLVGETSTVRTWAFVTRRARVRVTHVSTPSALAAQDARARRRSMPR